MLYMTVCPEGNYWTDCQAKVLSVTELPPPVQNQDKDKEQDQTSLRPKQVSVVLDRTVMHAQGGGQPTDIGTITSTATTSTNHHDEEEIVQWQLQVEKVFMDRASGVTTHTGVLDLVPNSSAVDRNKNSTVVPSSMWRRGTAVHVQVDVERRRLLSECHTAGHVVDAALAMCGLFWKPSKAYHFLEGPYVEYQVSNGGSTADASLLLPQLQTAFAQLLQQDWPTQIQLLSQEEALVLCNPCLSSSSLSSTTTTTTTVARSGAAPPPPIPPPGFMWYDDMEVFCSPHLGNRVRVVTVAGFSCPCGGTHVSNTRQLAAAGAADAAATDGQSPSSSRQPQPTTRHWKIVGLKRGKKGVVRIKYGCEEIMQED
ncbi:hypothetical protein ACA910_002506 [Epithemia clementina (nom. ined.)]